MTKDRAMELLNHKTKIGNVVCQTISVGDIRKHMTAEEVKEVVTVWEGITYGGASFYTALCKIARPETDW